MGRRTLSSVLLGTLFFFVPLVQAQVTEAEAHILSAFMTSADPGVFANNIVVGPELRRDVGPDPEPRELYEAIALLTAGRTLRVQFPPPAEAARYRAIPGANPNDPFVTLDTGEVRFVFQYAPKQKRVGFVEQLGGEQLARIAQRKRAEPPKPAVAAATKPRPPATSAPAPARIDPNTPRGECVIKPIMSELDLWNCSGPAQPAAVPVEPAPVAVQKPQAAPEPRRAKGECVIKPVMTDDDLSNCVGVTASTPPVFPVQAALVHSFAPPAPPARARPDCVIKPVMTDEEMRNCAAVSHSTPKTPPPAVATPVAAQKIEPPAPKPPPECVIKPVMSDEELRTCAALAKSTPSVPPVPSVSIHGPAAAAPAPGASTPAECIIKPVMSDQDLRNCASVPRSAGLLLIPIAVQAPATPAPVAPKPRPECVIKPVMSDDDLRACGSRR